MMDNVGIRENMLSYKSGRMLLGIYPGDNWEICSVQLKPLTAYTGHYRNF